MSRVAFSAASLLAMFTALAAAQAPSVPVRIAQAELRAMAPTVTVAGQVQTHSAVDLAAAVEGTLEFVADVGTAVARDQVVARLDTAALNLLRAEQIARVSRAQIALKSADRELARMQDSGDTVSRFQKDQAETSRDLARSDLEIARVTLQQTEERLSRAQFRAPFAGIVTERVKRSGEHANIGDVVARIAGSGGLEVHLFLPLRHVRAIKPGSEVAIHSERGALSKAPVHAIVPVGDPRSQSFEVVIDAQQLSPQPAVGTLLQVELPLAAPKQSIAVPRDALIIRAEGMAVFTITDGKAVRVPVVPGVADGDWVAVDGGVKAADSVVVRGGESLHDGDPVQIIAGSTS